MVWRLTSRPASRRRSKPGTSAMACQPMREQTESGRPIGLRQARVGNGLRPGLCESRYCERQGSSHRVIRVIGSLKSTVPVVRRQLSDVTESKEWAHTMGMGH